MTGIILLSLIFCGLFGISFLIPTTNKNSHYEKCCELINDKMSSRKATWRTGSFQFCIWSSDFFCHLRKISIMSDKSDRKLAPLWHIVKSFVLWKTKIDDLTKAWLQALYRQTVLKDLCILSTCRGEGKGNPEESCFLYAPWKHNGKSLTDLRII